MMKNVLLDFTIKSLRLIFIVYFVLLHNAMIIKIVCKTEGIGTCGCVIQINIFVFEISRN